MKKFNEYINESIRDQMTPKSKEEIIDSIGEENYKSYMLLKNAVGSIKKPFYLEDFVIDKKRDCIYFIVHGFGLATFNVSIVGEKWQLEYRKDYDYPKEYFNTWDESYTKIKELTKSRINEDVLEQQIYLSRIQSEINDLKKLIDVIDEKV